MFSYRHELQQRDDQHASKVKSSRLIKVESLIMDILERYIAFMSKLYNSFGFGASLYDLFLLFMDPFWFFENQLTTTMSAILERVKRLSIELFVLLSLSSYTDYAINYLSDKSFDWDFFVNSLTIFQAFFTAFSQNSAQIIMTQLYFDNFV